MRPQLDTGEQLSAGNDQPVLEVHPAKPGA